MNDNGEHSVAEGFKAILSHATILMAFDFGIHTQSVQVVCPISALQAQWMLVQAGGAGQNQGF